MNLPDVRVTNISMEWTDDGAVINSTIPITCPVCRVSVTGEHLCGTALLKPTKGRKKRVKTA
jgi:hypothetical protein